MFENAGSKLRSFAKILFWISVVAVTIIAIFLGIIAINYNFLIFISVLIGGILGVYVECLFLSAFGQLVESSTNSAAYSEQSADNTSKIIELCTKTPSSQKSVETKSVKPASPASSDSKPKCIQNQQVYRILSMAARFDTADGCQTYLKNNIAGLSDEEKEAIAPVIRYVNSSSAGIKIIVENTLNML